MDLKFNQFINKCLDKNQCVCVFKKIKEKMSENEKNKFIDDLIFLTKNIEEKINLNYFLMFYASANQNEKENIKKIVHDFSNFLEKNQIIPFLSSIKKNKYNLLLYTKFHSLFTKNIVKNNNIELFKYFDDFDDNDIYYIEKKIYEVYDICEKNPSNFDVIDILKYYNEKKKKNIDIEINTTRDLLCIFDKVSFNDAFCNMSQKYEYVIFQQFFKIIKKCSIDHYNMSHIISLLEKIKDIQYMKQNEIFLLFNSIEGKININFTEILKILNEIQNAMVGNMNIKSKNILNEFVKLSSQYSTWNKSDILFVCNDKRINAEKYLEAIEIISKNNHENLTLVEIYNKLRYISVANLKYFSDYTYKFLSIFNKKSTIKIDISYIIENINNFLKMYYGKNLIQKIYEIYCSYNLDNFYNFAVNFLGIILNYSTKNEKKMHFIIDKLEKIINVDYGQIVNIINFLWKYDEKKANFMIDECYRNLKLGVNKNIEDFIKTKKYETSSDIHQFSNINFENNLKKIQFELQINSTPILDYETCLHLTKNKINEIDTIEYFENENKKLKNDLIFIKKELINFLQKDKFINVLTMGKPKGKEVFEIVITYLCYHSDLWIAFITQSLWSSIIEDSCCMGIYERLIVWINYKDESDDFIEAIKKDIYYNANYEKLYYFDDDEYFDYYFEELKYVDSAKELKLKFENMMFCLYKELIVELEKKYKKNLDKIFTRTDIKEMFFVFDNETVRLEEFYNKISRSL